MYKHLEYCTCKECEHRSTCIGSTIRAVAVFGLRVGMLFEEFLKVLQGGSAEISIEDAQISVDEV